MMCKYAICIVDLSAYKLADASSRADASEAVSMYSHRFHQKYHCLEAILFVLEKKTFNCTRSRWGVCVEQKKVCFHHFSFSHRGSFDDAVTSDYGNDVDDGDVGDRIAPLMK